MCALKIDQVFRVRCPIFNREQTRGDYHDHGSGGHSHSHGPVSSEVAIKKATDKVRAIAQSGKIDKSWADVKATGAMQKTFGHETEWVVTFKNEKISDTSKKTLYLFYTLDGMYIAANFTGN